MLSKYIFSWSKANYIYCKCRTVASLTLMGKVYILSIIKTPCCSRDGLMQLSDSGLFSGLSLTYSSPWEMSFNTYRFYLNILSH